MAVHMVCACPLMHLFQSIFIDFLLKIHLNFSAESTWNKHCKGKGLDIESKCPKLRMVWVSCTGETLADTEYMGIINYTPRPGYPGYYFPYLNQNHYLR